VETQDRVSKGGLQHVFPHESVTRIVLRKK